MPKNPVFPFPLAAIQASLGALALLLTGACSSSRTPEQAVAGIATPISVSPTLLKGLSWRSVGPAHFSGRVSDVAGVPGAPDVLYIGFATAGLFKSIDGGVVFNPILETATTLSIGAIALAPADPDIIFVGTGEGNLRNSASYGDGIYKSSDAGKTWVHLGLEQTERFARIAVHPKNS